LQAEKLLATHLPFPYTSNDVYENSIRMPLGPDFNPAISVSALNRPAVSTSKTLNLADA
jgi:U3 small nucleolar RNA-associated protein 14